MKKHLIVKNIPYGTDEWYSFRLSGIGASECGGLTGLSPYTSAIQIYDTKIGLKEQWREPNAATICGQEMEELVAKFWNCYDGTEDGWVKNFTEKKILRKCKRVSGYIVNPKYPWLFASLDRMINKGMKSLASDMGVLTEECPLEIKTANQMQLKQWEAGVPPMYLAQVHQQMIVTETEYSEIVIFDNYRKLDVLPVKMNKAFAEQIIEVSHDFWYNRVLPGKKLVEELNEAHKAGNIVEAEKIMGAIYKLEPDADGSEAYKAYMNERFLEKPGTLLGSQAMYDHAVNALAWSEIGKAAGIKEEFHKNAIRAEMKEYQVLDFEDLGRVDWKSNKKGSRTMNIRLKDMKVDEDKVNGYLELINNPVELFRS